MLTQTKIVVTGGTGFIGTHLLNLLTSLGAQVTCLVRAESNTKNVPPNVVLRQVNLLTGEGVKDALAGHDIFVHAAALLFGCRWNDYLETNTQAAQTICTALRSLGSSAPRKVVLISSMAASGPSAPGEPVRDDAVPRPVSAYGWSKLLVERTFQSFYQGRLPEGGGTLVILRPSIVYGSGDRGLLPVFKGAKLGFCVSPGLHRDFPVSCVHGADMAKAIVCAFGDGAKGVYHVSDGQEYTMESFCLEMGKALGVRQHILHLPLPILAVSAALSTMAYRLAQRILPRCFGRAPNWNTDKLREARAFGWICDSSRLRNELGFTPDLSLAQGMRESVEGYRKRGWL